MEENKALWTIYDVEWRFITQLCGSVPADPEMIKVWLESRQPKVKPPGGKSIEEIGAEVIETLAEPEEEKLSMLIFQRHDGVLVLRAGTIRAHMKDCARVLSSLYVGKIQGERSFATRVINGVYLDESKYWITILTHNGEPIKKPSSERDKAIHTRNRQGMPINALKRFEFILSARINFTLKVLGDCVKESDLRHLFTYGGVHGYGGERGDGEGKYIYALAKREKEGKRGNKKAA